MSNKFSTARKQAFLRALSESGNQTLSAERAKVSRSWVCLHRAQDPAFDAACREAIGEAKESLRRAPDQVRGDGRSDGPPAGWAFANGVETVVRGTNGRRTQVARARLGQWTRSVEQRFLIALANSCNVKAACREIGMSHGSAYAHRHRRPAFAAAWDEAIAAGYARIEAGMIEGAIRFFEGEPVPDDAAVRCVSIAEAIQALNMNKFAVKGVGKAPGRRGRHGVNP